MRREPLVEAELAVTLAHEHVRARTVTGHRQVGSVLLGVNASAEVRCGIGSLVKEDVDLARELADDQILLSVTVPSDDGGGGAG